MINNVNSTSYIKKTQATQKFSIAKGASKKNSTSLVNISLVDNIITDLQNNKKTVSKDNIQQRIVLLVLNDLLGEQASSENKFKALYDKVNKTLTHNSEGQSLIVDAIKKYDLNQ